jgi:hypothetical protein
LVTAVTGCLLLAVLVGFFGAAGSALPGTGAITSAVEVEEEVAENYAGVWHKTNAPRSERATVVIANQADGSFDYEFEGWWGANSGVASGTAFMQNGGGAIHNGDDGDVSFVSDGDKLIISSVDADGQPISPNGHIYVAGEFTRGEPTYTNANLLNELLPTEELKARVFNLLGASAFDDLSEVAEYGTRRDYADETLDALTYSGFINGAGLGADLLLDGDKIYCLIYKNYDSGDWAQTFYTNDAAYTNVLPPQFVDARSENAAVKYVYRRGDGEAPAAPHAYDLGLDAAETATLELYASETARTADGGTATVYYYGCQTEGQVQYSHHVLFVDYGGCTRLCAEIAEGFPLGDFYIADVDGDGADEILLHVQTDAFGGMGQFSSYIYKISEGGMTALFDSGAAEFDTGFTLSFADGYKMTVGNENAELGVTFEHRYDDANPYFDADGNTTSAPEPLYADAAFYEFKPADIDGDGVFELVTAQYASLWGHSDALGAAYTILRWNGETGALDVIKAGFWADEEVANDADALAEYWARWDEFGETWYK